MILVMLAADRCGRHDRLIDALVETGIITHFVSRELNNAARHVATHDGIVAFARDVDSRPLLVDDDVLAQRNNEVLLWLRA
jgi:hypothetical protein